jgi:predicted nucleotidyltransferase
MRMDVVRQRPALASRRPVNPAARRRGASGCDAILEAMAQSERGEAARDVLRRKRGTIVAFVEARGGSNPRLFGSLARGDDDETSDIDVLIDLPPGSSAGDELLVALGLSEELSELVGARVHVATPRILRDTVRAALEDEAVAL